MLWQVLGIQFLELCLSNALRINMLNISSILMSTSYMTCGFPLPLFHFIRSLVTSFTRLSSFKKFSSVRFCLSNTVFKSFLFSFTLSHTYSLVFDHSSWCSPYFAMSTFQKLKICIFWTLSFFKFAINKRHIFSFHTSSRYI